MATIGFVGLGTMGSRLARRLLDGNTLYGTNRTPAKAAGLIAHGMIWRDTPRQVTEAADIVFSMVTDDAALHAITAGPDGVLAALGPGKIFVDMSTVGPETADELTQQVEARGAQMVSAPVTGPVPAAADGSMLIMAGGPSDAVTAIEPLLYRLGRQVTYVSTQFQALVLKLAININLTTQILAFSEALLLAERAGIDPVQAAHVMTDSVIGSPAMATRAPLAFYLPEHAWFDIDAMSKDLRLACVTADNLGTRMTTAAIASDAIEHAVQRGFGHRDLSGLYASLRTEQQQPNIHIDQIAS